MDNIDKIRELMKQTKSIIELVNVIRQNEFPAVYMREADDSLKKQNNIDINEKWHRFFVETGSTPVNKWENITKYTTVLISDNLQEMKVINRCI
ncbi:MAG: hypothetical protein JW787_15485 [Sedimentisphaerales bacterium]|nr:hypothetical protein [Sedimentisphaerales bacterium]